MRMTSQQKGSVPPWLTAVQGLELLHEQFDGIASIKVVKDGQFAVSGKPDDPEVVTWERATKRILNGIFGKPGRKMHPKTEEFDRCCQEFASPGRSLSGVYAYPYRANRWRAILEPIIDDLEVAARACIPSLPYQFHRAILAVSGDLYRNGHYKPAALEAFTRVIEEIKRKSGLQLEGDNLVNHAFGFQKLEAVIKFNRLLDAADEDEQKGLMYLYKGMIGLRNWSAHRSRPCKDSERGYEYLALASLLMRALER